MCAISRGYCDERRWDTVGTGAKYQSMDEPMNEPKSLGQIAFDGFLSWDAGHALYKTRWETAAAAVADEVRREWAEEQRITGLAVAECERFHKERNEALSECERLRRLLATKDDELYDLRRRKNAAQDERDSLRAEVERLRKERDDACRERDEYLHNKSEVERLRQFIADMPTGAVPPEHELQAAVEKQEEPDAFERANAGTLEVPTKRELLAAAEKLPSRSRTGQQSRPN